MEKKVIKDEKVAVAISPGFGAGWTTWNKGVSPFEPKIIKMIQDGRQKEITEEWCAENGLLTEDGITPYVGGVSDLEIEWIPVGTAFSINEYDGSESIYRAEELKYIA